MQNCLFSTEDKFTRSFDISSCKKRLKINTTDQKLTFLTDLSTKRKKNNMKEITITPTKHSIENKVYG